MRALYFIFIISIIIFINASVYAEKVYVCPYKPGQGGICGHIESDSSSSWVDSDWVAVDIMPAIDITIHVDGLKKRIKELEDDKENMVNNLEKLKNYNFNKQQIEGLRKLIQNEW